MMVVRKKISRTCFFVAFCLIGMSVDDALSLNAQELNTNITSGAAHTCALLEDGGVKCWGANNYGQLGYGDTSPRARPPDTVIDIGRRRKAIQISAGDFHTCALLDNGRVKCWGRGDDGRLGRGDTTTLNAPPKYPLRFGRLWKRAVQVVSGGSHSCALLSDDTVSCWGLGTAGQLGYGDNQTHTSPPAESISVFGNSQATVQIATGGTHTCALSGAGGVKCWGGNSDGQLGYGDTANRSAHPKDIVNLGRAQRAIQIATGSTHTCALINRDELKCWGANTGGQLGYDPRDISRLTAPPLSSIYQDANQGISNIAAGSQHVCVLIDGGQIKCWGGGNSGQLGYGEREDIHSIPADTVGNLTEASQIALGGEHTCVLFEINSIRCWGGGNRGQLGYGGTNALLTPNTAVTID